MACAHIAWIWFKLDQDVDLSGSYVTERKIANKCKLHLLQAAHLTEEKQL